MIQETVWLDETPVATLWPSGGGELDVSTRITCTRCAASRGRVTTPLWRWDSDPFGTSAAHENAVEYNLRFPGQYYDVETGLHYNYFRDYDLVTGRYVQSY